jgi:hypothetical protein
MRGGGAQAVGLRGDPGVTTDLLSEWTDPDTAIEAVGNALGRFDDAPSAVQALRADPALRDALLGVVVRMVDGGVLATRGLADGRCAYRWSGGLGEVTRDQAFGLVTTYAEPPPERAPAPGPAAAAPVPGFWARMALQTAPLLLPSVSCVLALLAFLWLDTTLALLVTAVLAVVGVVGIVRRVQLAAFWMIGLVIAGLLVRFS